MGEMDCSELVERVTDCIEGALDAQTLMSLLDHLQVCPGCDDHFNQVMVTLKTVSSVPAESLPAELQSSLLEVHREWTAELGGVGEGGLSAWSRGDESAFRTLVRDYHSSLFRLAMIYSPSPATAEELVRETWLAVLREPEGLADQASFRTGVCRLLVDIARQRSGGPTRSTPLSTVDGDGGFSAVSPELFFESGQYPGHWKEFREDWSRLPEGRMLSQELRGVVTGAISELRPAQREVITLRDLEGWSASEVSDLLHIEGGNQRVLLHQARSRVRQVLEDHLAPPLAA